MKIKDSENINRFKAASFRTVNEFTDIFTVPKVDRVVVAKLSSSWSTADTDNALAYDTFGSYFKVNCQHMYKLIPKPPEAWKPIDNYTIISGDNQIQNCVINKDFFELFFTNCIFENCIFANHIFLSVFCNCTFSNCLFTWGSASNCYFVQCQFRQSALASYIFKNTIYSNSSQVNSQITDLIDFDAVDSIFDTSLSRRKDSVYGHSVARLEQRKAQAREMRAILYDPAEDKIQEGIRRLRSTLSIQFQ